MCRSALVGTDTVKGGGVFCSIVSVERVEYLIHGISRTVPRGAVGKSKHQ